jgi:hypothetical protein
VKIVRSYSDHVISDGADIISATAVLNNESTDKVLELVNTYLDVIRDTCSKVSIDDDDLDYPIYAPLYTVVSHISMDVLMTANLMEYIHKQITLTVDKIGVYFKRVDKAFVPCCIGLHISDLVGIPRHSGNSKSKEYICVWTGQYTNIQVVHKCFERIDTTDECTIWYSIDPIEINASYEFVNNKYRYINEFSKEFIESASRIKELGNVGCMTESQKYAQDSSILRKFGADDSTVLILKRASLGKISDVTRVLDSNPKRIKSLRGIASKRYASLVTAVNNLLGTSYSTNY